MRGCMQIMAGLFAALFVLTAVLALFTVNLVNVVTDRDLVRQAVNELDRAITEAIPSLVAQTVRAQARARGLPDINVDEAILEEAFNELLPPGWLEEQTSAAVETFFDALETGDAETAELTVDTRPLLDRLRGEPGRQVVGVIVDSLPTCTEAAPPPNLAEGMVELPGCIPPGVPTQQVAQQAHTSLVQALDQNPQIVGEAGVVRIPLFAGVEGTQREELVQMRETLQRVQRSFDLARRWTWLLWLLPVGCLLMILLLAVRSVTGFGHWWGWPILVTAVIVLAGTFLIPFMATWWLQAALLPADLQAITEPVRLFLQRLVDTITALWLRRVLIQAGLMLVAGIFLVIIGFIAGAFRRQPQL